MVTPSQPRSLSHQILEGITPLTSETQSAASRATPLIAVETIRAGTTSPKAELLSLRTVTPLQNKTADNGPKQYADNADLSDSTNMKAQEVVSELKDNFGIGSTPPAVRAEESEKNQILRQKIIDLMRLKNRVATDTASGLSNKQMAYGAVSFSFPDTTADPVITISGHLKVETYIKITESLLKSEWKKENHLHERHFDTYNKESKSENCVRCLTATNAWKQFLLSLHVNPSIDDSPKFENFVYSFAEGIELLKGYLKKGKVLEAFKTLTEKLGVPKEELFAAYYGLKETSDTKEHFIKSCEFMKFDHGDEARKEAVSLKVFERTLQEIRDKKDSYWVLQGFLGQTDVLETLLAAVGKKAYKKIIADFSLKEPTDEKLRIAVQKNWEVIVRKNMGFAHLLTLLPENLKKSLFNTIYCLRGMTGEIDDVQDAFLESPTDPLVFKAIGIIFENGKLILPSNLTREAKTFCQKVTQETLSEEFAKLSSDIQHKIITAAWIKSGGSSDFASFSAKYKMSLNKDDVVGIVKVLS